VVGVSCNPTTFARDARVLIDAGFTLTRVKPVDQFLWSPHMELVGVFTR
jgi:23S rRNA (uracil1939-C5)-methyltransferase